MSKKDVEQKSSETALFAALYRAVANKEFKNQELAPDYLAEFFLPSLYKFLIKFKTIRTKIKNKDKKLTPGMYEYMLARTAFFDNVFIDALNNNIPQIVLLGAGYDTRAWRFEKLNNTTKIETVATIQSFFNVFWFKMPIFQHRNINLCWRLSKCLDQVNM